LARPILSALQEAHAQGVVHRDLKPQNVMVDNQGTPYLMDFGIARSVDTMGHTATGVILGTPDYMSPEQVRGEMAGPVSDLFSFGVILYEMLTGTIPFPGESPISKIMMRITQKPPALHERTSGIPPYLDHVVQRCLEVEPRLRYQSAAEVLADLDRGQVVRPFGLRVRVAARRHPTALAAAAALAVAVGVYLFWGRAPAD